MMMKPTTGHEIDSSSTGHYVYGHSIRIPILDGDDGKQPVTLSRYVMVSGSLILNCAFAYHLLALKQSNNEALLQKAARLYEHGLELHNQGTGRWEYFVVVSLNNVGKVYRALGEKEKYATCFHKLLGCLASLISAASRTRNAGLTDESVYYEVFFESVLQSFLANTTMGVAPAA
jgi:hypothetical protein